MYLDELAGKIPTDSYFVGIWREENKNWDFFIGLVKSDGEVFSSFPVPVESPTSSVRESYYDRKDFRTLFSRLKSLEFELSQ